MSTATAGRTVVQMQKDLEGLAPKECGEYVAALTPEERAELRIANDADDAAFEVAGATWSADTTRTIRGLLLAPVMLLQKAAEGDDDGWVCTAAADSLSGVAQRLTDYTDDAHRRRQAADHSAYNLAAEAVGAAHLLVCEAIADGGRKFDKLVTAAYALVSSVRLLVTTAGPQEG